MEKLQGNGIVSAKLLSVLWAKWQANADFRRAQATIFFADNNNMQVSCCLSDHDLSTTILHEVHVCYGTVNHNMGSVHTCFLVGTKNN